jgi:ankyrin repeat protein
MARNHFDVLLADAAKDGNLETARMLVSLRADPRSIASGNSSPPIGLAAIAGHPDLVHFLIPLSDLSAVDRNGSTPLFLAVRGGHAECASLLAEAGPVDATRSALSQAKLILPEKLPSVDLRDPLSEALFQGSAQIAQIILDRLPAANRPQNLSLAAARALRGWWRAATFSRRSGWDTQASRDEREEALAFFADDFDWSWRDERGRTLLAYAARGGVPDFARLALSRSDARAARADGEWPFFHLGPDPDIEVAREILRGADRNNASMPLDAISSLGSNALSVLAPARGCEDLAREVLAQCPALARQADAQGRTPLMLAVQHLTEDATPWIEELLAASDANAIDANGDSALTLFLTAANQSFLGSEEIFSVFDALLSATAFQAAQPKIPQILSLLRLNKRSDPLFDSLLRWQAEGEAAALLAVSKRQPESCFGAQSGSAGVSVGANEQSSEPGERLARRSPARRV